MASKAHENVCFRDDTLKRTNDTAEFPWLSTRPANATLERQVASRVPTVEADVLVPLHQALTTGVFGMAAGAGIATLLFRDWLAAVIGASAGFLVVAGTAWLLLLADHRRLLWDIERAARLETAATDRVLRVEVAHMDATGRLARMQLLNVPGVTEEQLRQFARLALDGRTLAVGAWCGAGKPFTRAQYDALMAELTTAGLVRDHGGNIGRQLTAAGRAVLRRIAG